MGVYVAVLLLVGAIALAAAGCTAWLVYSVLEIRRDMATSFDLNELADHVEAVSGGVSKMDADYRVQFSNADSDMKARYDSAKSTSERLQEQITSLRGDVTQQGLADTLLASNVDVLGSQVTAIEMSLPDFDTFATWSSIANDGLVASRLTATEEVTSQSVKAGHYAFSADGDASRVSGYIVSPSGGGLQYVPVESGTKPDPDRTTLTSQGLRWGSKELKADDKGRLSYCVDSVCRPVAMEDPPKSKDAEKVSL